MGIILCGLLMVACHPTPTGQLLSEFGAGALPPADSVLILAGSRIPVQLEGKLKNGELVVHLKTHGEVLELEQYRTSTKSFELLSAAGESYQPGIPLLLERIQAGDTWTWKGNSMMQLPGEQPRPNTARKATATVTLAQDTLNLAGAHHESMRADVMLMIHDGSPSPIPRKLQFWFVKEKGILKREFAMSSTRQPADSRKPTE